MRGVHVSFLLATELLSVLPTLGFRLLYVCLSLVVLQFFDHCSSTYCEKRSVIIWSEMVSALMFPTHKARPWLLALMRKEMTECQVGPWGCTPVAQINPFHAKLQCGLLRINQGMQCNKWPPGRVNDYWLKMHSLKLAYQHQSYGLKSSSFCYPSLGRECPWAAHPTCSPKWRGGTLLSVYAFI